jgi:hypothetical protein
VVDAVPKFLRLQAQGFHLLRVAAEQEQHER